MECRYFERLIIDHEAGSGRELNVSQSRALQEHLRECAHCRKLQTDWGKVHTLFAVESARPLAQPRTGFTDRWRKRREEERKAEERRQIWSALSFFLGAAGMSLSMLVVWLFMSMGSPVDWAMQSVQQMNQWVVFCTAVQRLLGSLNELVRTENGASALALIILLLGLLAAIWGISLQRIIKVRRLNL